MSRKRRMLNGTYKQPDQTMVRTVTLNRIGIVESIKNGQPHISVAAPGVSLADLDRLLQAALAVVQEEQAKKQLAALAN